MNVASAYKTLNLRPGSNLYDAGKAYRKLAFSSIKQDNDERTSNLQEAFEILRHPDTLKQNVFDYRPAAQRRSDNFLERRDVASYLKKLDTLGKTDSLYDPADRKSNRQPLDGSPSPGDDTHASEVEEINEGIHSLPGLPSGRCSLPEREQETAQGPFPLSEDEWISSSGGHRPDDEIERKSRQGPLTHHSRADPVHQALQKSVHSCTNSSPPSEDLSLIKEGINSDTPGNVETVVQDAATGYHSFNIRDFKPDFVEQTFSAIDNCEADVKQVMSQEPALHGIIEVDKPKPIISTEHTSVATEAVLSTRLKQLTIKPMSQMATWKIVLWTCVSLAQTTSSAIVSKQDVEKKVKEICGISLKEKHNVPQSQCAKKGLLKFDHSGSWQITDSGFAKAVELFL